MPNDKKSGMGGWVDEIFNSVGKYVHLETKDGVRREGRISGLRLRHIVFNRRKVSIVDELELNGDPTDCVQMDVVSTLMIE